MARARRSAQFRTLPPPGSRAPIKIGIFSCQDYVAGLLHGPRRPRSPRTTSTWSSASATTSTSASTTSRSARTRPERTATARCRRLPSTATSTRSTTRTRTSGSSARRFPLAAIWDDHEVEDNYSSDEPGRSDDRPACAIREAQAKRLPRLLRAHAVRARRAPGKENRFRIYRSIKLGHTAEILLLDQRQYRDEQPCGDTIPPTPPCTDAERNDPERTFLGDEPDGLAQAPASLVRRRPGSWSATRR